MRFRLYALPILLWASALALVAGCSSGGDGGGGGTSCSDSDECTRWRCTCNDGSAPSISACIMNRCGDQSLCSDMCEDRGGLKSAEPAPSVAGTPECDAFCAKVASLNCSGSTRCNESFWCGVDSILCAEQKREYLQCVVDTGSWECIEGGWSMTSGCPDQSHDCAQDAGTD